MVPRHPFHGRTFGRTCIVLTHEKVVRYALLTSGQNYVGRNQMPVHDVMTFGKQWWVRRITTRTYISAFNSLLFTNQLC